MGANKTVLQSQQKQMATSMVLYDKYIACTLFMQSITF